MSHRSWLAFVVIDAAELEPAARFWSGALRGRVVRQPFGPGIYLTVMVPVDAGEIPLLIQRVPEGKTAKSRLHLDIASDDIDAEADRLRRLGARPVRTVEERDVRFHVLQDPDGNEFCVVPGARSDDWPRW